jgi:hypothetical protein
MSFTIHKFTNSRINYCRQNIVDVGVQAPNYVSRLTSHASRLSSHILSGGK